MAMILAKKNLSEEELIALAEQQIAQSNEQFIKLLKQSLKAIKDLDPKDRLDLAHAIWVIVECMKGSLKGWDGWTNLRSMKLLSEEDLKRIVPIMKELALKWIQVDIDTTQAQTDKLLAKIKKRQKPKKTVKTKKKRSKDIYVA